MQTGKHEGKYLGRHVEGRKVTGRKVHMNEGRYCRYEGRQIRKDVERRKVHRKEG
jgi:hypothetical protein